MKEVKENKEQDMGDDQEGQPSTFKEANIARLKIIMEIWKIQGEKILKIKHYNFYCNQTEKLKKMTTF